MLGHSGVSTLNRTPRSYVLPVQATKHVLRWR
jgi:2-polyprenyl-3-methyl-5-hydroxy-6-metoxy-1,4-benzoquinol methylase